MGTKNDPGNYDCYANAHPDEPMFVLLGRDDRSPALVETWADVSELRGGDPAKVAEARACAAAMRRWRQKPMTTTAPVPAPSVDYRSLVEAPGGPSISGAGVDMWWLRLPGQDSIAQAIDATSEDFASVLKQYDQEVERGIKIKADLRAALDILPGPRKSVDGYCHCDGQFGARHKRGAEGCLWKEDDPRG